MINPQLRALRMEILRDKALRERWEERAAIMQYDGGLSREDAEEQAMYEVLNARPRDVDRFRPAPERYQEAFEPSSRKKDAFEAF
jgi:hypothetical protein